MPAQAQPAGPISNEEILRYFARSAFGTEFTSADDQEAQTLLRWQEPWRVAMIGPEIAPYHEVILAEVLNWIGVRTDLAIDRIDDPNAANIIVLLYDDPNTVRRFAHNLAQGQPRFHAAPYHVEAIFAGARSSDVPACLAFLRQNREDGRLWPETAYVFVPLDESEARQRACFYEELAQTTGLRNDSSANTRSMFNNRLDYIEPTEADDWMLRLLYSDELAPGMAFEEAMRKAARVLKKLRPLGEA